MRSRRTLLAAWITGVLVLSGYLTSGRASAAITACRSDPIVSLTNGTTVNLTATVSDPSTDIQSIVYTLHVPGGVRVTNVTYTGGPFANKEQLIVYSDNPGRTYSSDTIVYTNHHTYSVTASTAVHTNSATQSASTDGYDTQHLTAKVTV